MKQFFEALSYWWELRPRLRVCSFCEKKFWKVGNWEGELFCGSKCSDEYYGNEIPF